MSDDKKPLSGQAALIGLLFELSKTMSALEKTSDKQLRELEKIRTLQEAFAGISAGDDEPAPTSSPSPSPGTTAPAASGSGLDFMIEEMLAEQLGIDPAALRDGKLDKEIVRKLIRDARANKVAAST